MQEQLPVNRLRELREEHGLARYDIAARFRVDPTTVWRWETRESAIPDVHKPALAEMLSVSVAYLMGWSDVRAESVA